MTRFGHITFAVAVAVGISASKANPQDEHWKAAAALNAALTSVDSKTTIKLVASSMAAQDPTLKKHVLIVERWLADQIASPAYSEAKITAYVSVYSKEELDQILFMVKTPAFKIFQAKHQETLRQSAPKLIQLARDNQSELERRIQEAERTNK